MSWLRSVDVSWVTGGADLSTAHGRSRERFRRIGLTSSASVAARGIGFATALITVPLTLGYLGAERYGMWSTLSSIIALASFADLGLGNGLLNALARAHGRDDPESARELVSTAFAVLLAIAAALAVAFVAAYPVIDWSRVFNVTSPAARRESGPATAMFVACFLINLPIAIVARVRQAYQEGFKTSFYEAAGTIAGLLLVVAAINARAPLIWLVAAMAGAPVIANVVHALVLFGRDRPAIRPNVRAYHSDSAKRLLHTGLLFFALQLAGALYYAPDNLIIAQLRGATAVTHYAVVAKLFSLSMLLADVALTPFWPAYTEAMARGDAAWVFRTLTRALRLTAIVSAGLALLLVASGNTILTLWVGPEMTVSMWLLAGLGVWSIVGALGTAAAMYLNAANLLWYQLACAAVMVPVSLVLKSALVARFGSSALPWALTVSYIAFVGIPLAVAARRGRLRWA